MASLAPVATAIITQGTFLMTQGAVKSMIENKVGNGSIINISSIVGKVDCSYSV